MSITEKEAQEYGFFATTFRKWSVNVRLANS